MRKPVSIICTLAGQSRRFQKVGIETPKAFLQIGHKKMIEHVVDMFSAEDHFYFVVNEEQVRDFPEEIQSLKSLASKVDITVIPCHELGPTYSALQVKNISPDSDVIVTYCDFTVDWDYEKFLRKARHAEAAVPSFRGFHPASFGDTYYAYMRVDGDQFLELREKKSFTEKRHEEHASVGIYYFQNMDLFRKYGEELLQKKDLPLKEYYTSLLFNYMKEDGVEIIVHEVEKFICLGTPEDVAQYQFWFRYFCEPHERPNQVLLENQLNLLPMAGAGSRFQKDGYNVSKPLVQVGAYPMLVKAMQSYPLSSEWVILHRHDEIQEKLKSLLDNYEYHNTQFIELKEMTSGQAVTCLKAESFFNEQETNTSRPLFIASCDYDILFNQEAWKNVVSDQSIDVAIWTVRLKSLPVNNPEAFAYCESNNDLDVQKIVEKKTISDSPQNDPLVTGSFWFRRAEDFVTATQQMIDKNITVNGEHYVGTAINQLIEAGKRVVIFEVDQWVSFGNPFELSVYQYWEDYFYNSK